MRKQNPMLAGLALVFALSAGHAEPKDEPKQAEDPAMDPGSPMQLDMEFEGPGKTMKMDSMDLGAGVCAANLQLNYYQADTEVHVASTLTNDSCGASQGEYTIRVRYRDADGELQSKEFEESWKRAGEESLEVERNYTIGEDVKIVRVSSKGLSCECL